MSITVETPKTPTIRLQSDIGWVIITPEGFDRIQAHGGIDRICRYNATLIKDIKGQWFVSELYAYCYSRHTSAKASPQQHRRIRADLPAVIQAWADNPASYDAMGLGQLKHRQERLAYLQSNLSDLKKALYDAQKELDEALVEIKQLETALGLPHEP